MRHRRIGAAFLGPNSPLSMSAHGRLPACPAPGASPPGEDRGGINSGAAQMGAGSRFGMPGPPSNLSSRSWRFLCRLRETSNIGDPSINILNMISSARTGLGATGNLGWLQVRVTLHALHKNEKKSSMAAAQISRFSNRLVAQGHGIESLFSVPDVHGLAFFFVAMCHDNSNSRTKAQRISITTFGGLYFQARHLEG